MTVAKRALLAGSFCASPGEYELLYFCQFFWRDRFYISDVPVLFQTPTQHGKYASNRPTCVANAVCC